MMLKLIKLFGIISMVFLASCARNFEPIETSQIFSSAVEDIKKIEEIARDCDISVSFCSQRKSKFMIFFIFSVFRKSVLRNFVRCRISFVLQ